MKAIVIQKHTGNLLGIKECVARLDGARAEEIIFTSNPEVVLESVRDGSRVMVVSGQVLGRGRCGTDLARMVKMRNPRAMFFIYSVMPERNEDVDGIIPKEGGTLVTGEHSLVASILANVFDEDTPASIKSVFQTVI